MIVGQKFELYAFVDRLEFINDRRRRSKKLCRSVGGTRRKMEMQGASPIENQCLSYGIN